MYIPPHYRNNNQPELFAFMQAHPFALLTCNGEKIPLATHLPFVIEETDGRITISSHFSAGNPQSRVLQDGHEVLIIFSGPNAYISPAHYDHQQNVPTWNYIAVHASGIYRAENTDEQKEKLLRQMIHTFEPAYRAQYDSLDRKYIEGMLKGIVAFSVEVTNLEGKFKLSQNKTANEQKRIADSMKDDELKKQMNKNL